VTAIISPLFPHRLGLVLLLLAVFRVFWVFLLALEVLLDLLALLALLDDDALLLITQTNRLREFMTNGICSMERFYRLPIPFFRTYHKEKKLRR